jgi:carboxymethylenebutenolidase
MKVRLDQALTEAGVAHRVETYPARHGWVLRDTPAYNEAASERHWREVDSLFQNSLKH